MSWAQCNALRKARGLLTIGLDKHMAWLAAASGQRGRSPKCSEGVVEFGLPLKNLLGLVLCQTTGLVQLVLQLTGLIWPAPNFNTLSRRQQTLNSQIPYTCSQAGLHLLVDSTGIKCLCEGEWKRNRHGSDDRRQLRFGLGMDAHTMQIRATCMTSNFCTPAVCEKIVNRLLQNLADLRRRP